MLANAGFIFVLLNSRSDLSVMSFHVGGSQKNMVSLIKGRGLWLVQGFSCLSPSGCWDRGGVMTLVGNALDPDLHRSFQWSLLICYSVVSRGTFSE